MVREARPLGGAAARRRKRSRRRPKPAFAALEVRLPLSGFALQIQDAFLPLRQSVPDWTLSHRPT